MSKSKVTPLKTPERTLVIGNEPVKLRADFNAMYTLEELTGQNLFDIASDQGNKKIYTVVAQLLYALSASHRDDAGQELTFKQFLKTLPDIGMSEFERLSRVTFAMIGEAMGSASGNAPTPAT